MEADLREVPSWDWGRGLPVQTVMDLTEQADACNEAAALLIQAAGMFRLASRSLDTAHRDVLPASGHRRAVFQPWFAAASDYQDRVARLYLRSAASFAASSAAVLGSVISGKGVTDDPPSSMPVPPSILIALAEQLLPLHPQSDDRTDAVPGQLRELEEAHHAVMQAVDLMRSRATKDLSELDDPMSPERLRIDHLGMGAFDLAAACHAYGAACLWETAWRTREAMPDDAPNP